MQNHRHINRCKEPTEFLKWLEKAWDADDVAGSTWGNADSGEVKSVFKGRMTLSSPRWSRPRCPELVAGSGKHVVVVVVKAMYDTWESM